MNDYSTREAEAIGRHVKAALLHLRQAEDIAEAAGIDLDASEHDPGPAGQFRAASQAVQDLDMWAVGNAREHGAVTAQTYEHTERWCHASGGHLPATSWPAEAADARVPLESEGLRQVQAYLDQADERDREGGQ